MPSAKPPAEPRATPPGERLAEPFSEAGVPSHRSRWGLAALPLVAAVAPYLPLFPGEFTRGDQAIIERSADLADPRRVLLDPFATDRIDPDYRPLGLLAWSTEVGRAPSPSRARAIHVALNAAAALLAWLVLRELVGDGTPAALCAALFAALPVRSETVASLAARGDILGTIAVLATWWIALRASRVGATERPLHVLAAGTITLLGVFAAGYSAAIIPLVVVLSALILRRRAPWNVVAASACSVVGYLALRFVMLQGQTPAVPLLDNPLGRSDLLVRALNGARLVGLHAWKCVAPIDLTTEYGYPEIAVRGAGDPVVWAVALGVIAAFAAAIVLTWRRHRVVALSLVLFLLAIAPSLSLLRTERVLLAERFASTASFALPLALAGLVAGTASGRIRRAGTVAIGVLVLLAAGRTWARSLDWATSSSMESLVATRPAREVWTLFRAAEEAQRERRWAEGVAATESLERLLAARRVPTIEPTLLFIRGTCLLGLGRDAEALAAFDRYLVELRRLGRAPDATTMSQRGLVLGRLGRLAEAEEAFDAALRISREDPATWNNRGFCRYRRGNLEGAVADYLEGAKLCRRIGLLHAASGDSSFAFLLRIADIFEEAARRHEREGNPDKARMSRELAASHRAQAASLAPSR